MSLTQEKRLDANFANNNDQSYLHKKFKKMASSISVFSPNSTKGGEGLHKEANVVHPACDTIITNGSIAAGHPEIERIKLKQEKHNADIEVEKNVQINYNDENSRLSNVNNNIQLSGQTSFTDEFSHKTDNLENDFIRESYNGGASGRYICPYCKLSCAKPSVLQKHIRAHTNERPYPCVPCGFAFKTKSNLYKHRRSRTHALRLQGTDVAASLNDEDLSGGSESDTSMPPTAVSDTASDVHNRYDNLRSNEISSPELTCDGVSQINIDLSAIENSKSKTIYKPKFRAAFYQDFDDKDKLKKTILPNADFLTEHISKIISDNEAIVDVIETPLQKKYGKIKQIAESKQFLNDSFDIKTDSIPLNLTKNNIEIENNFRKRSHSESFSQIDHQKHPLNPEGSIIKDLLLKTKSNGLTPVTSDFVDGQGPLFVCPLCQIMYRSADNLEIHRNYYCKGLLNNTTLMSTTQKDIKVVRPENIFMRSNSVNVRLPETQQNSYSKTNAPNTSINTIKSKPDNLVIMKSEPSDIAAPMPSPGPLLGNTRLVDSKSSLDISRKNENVKLKPMASPKRRIENRSESYSPRLIENVSPRSADLYAQPKIRCIDVSASGLVSHHMRHNSASLQMFGGEVKIVDHSGSTTTLRIEPSKNQLSPILIQHNLSPSKLGSDTEGSSIVVRSGLHSGGTIMHNPPTPKDVIGTPQPQTSRMSLSNAPSISSSNLPNLHELTHFQFPPLSAITAYNPLTLPPLSPSATASPSGATTILHGGKLIPHVPGMPGPTNAGVFVGNQSAQPTIFLNNENIKNNSKKVREDVHSPVTSVDIQTSSIITGTSYDPKLSRRSPNLRAVHIESEKHQKGDIFTSDISQYIPTVPIIKVKNVDDPEGLCKTFSTGLIKSIIPKQDGVLKRSINGSPRTAVLKENTYYPVKNKSKDRINSNPMFKGNSLLHSDAEIRNFNFENLITKVEIYNNQIPSPSEVQKNTNAQDNSLSIQNERSETLYFQKTIASKSTPEEIKPKFLRPTTLPLKPGTFTPKRHHGITPTANTMSLVSPETPRPAKAYGQLYLNGNAYTYLGLKCSTKVFYCTINRPQPTYVPNQHFLSMYSNWQLLSELTPDPLGLSASSAMSLYDSRHRPQNMTVSVMKQDLILTHSSQWKSSKDNNQTIMAVDPRKVEEDKLNCENNLNAKRELTGGFESNEEYTYVRGRGRGRYVCSECGIRCKKPSMLKKHIRTHTDVRPYTCVHCAFSFKTKGNLTKHMKSKAHYKKCCELGINPNEGTDMEGGEMNQCSGETDDETDSEGDEGNEGETESSDTEVCKSRLPEHEAAHCLLSLGGSRPASSAAPGLLTSARPTTYPYTPTGLENANLELSPEKLMSRSSSIDSRLDAENEPMDLSKSDVKMSPNIPEIPTARESSVLASLASNTAKLPQHQSQWSNGEPMLHTYLTERALLDSKIKQSQLTCSLSKLRKIDLEKPALVEKDCGKADNTIIVATTNCITSCISSPKIIGVSKVKNENEDNSKITTVSKEEVIHVRDAPSPSLVLNVDNKRVNTPNNTNAENAKHVVSEYLKQARINLIKSQDEILNSQVSQDNSSDDGNSTKIGMEENTQGDELLMSETDPLKLPALEHDPIARKVVIGVGGVAFKVTKGKEFDGSSSFPTGRLMEDGRRVCDFCNKTFTKPSQLRLHLNIHYMERPFRCSVCAVSFRTRGHLQKHERSGSHHNKVSMTSTFGAATSFNPRPFRCSDCNIAFRIHGHLAKHLRSKMHVMRLECLFKLPFGTFTEIERAGVSLTDIDTTDCASSLASLQSLARKLHEKDPTKLEYREPTGSSTGVHPGRDSSEDDDAGLLCEKTSDSEKDIDMKTIDSENIGKETRVNYSATDN